MAKVIAQRVFGERTIIVTDQEVVVGDSSRIPISEIREAEIDEIAIVSYGPLLGLAGSIGTFIILFSSVGWRLIQSIPSLQGLFGLVGFSLLFYGVRGFWDNKALVSEYYQYKIKLETVSGNEWISVFEHHGPRQGVPFLQKWHSLREIIAGIRAAVRFSHAAETSDRR